jgi:hypothetical protein
MAVYNEAQRRKYATWIDSQGKPHFPIGDEAHARFAMVMISHAPADKRLKIAKKAQRFLGCTEAISRYTHCRPKK